MLFTLSYFGLFLRWSLLKPFLGAIRIFLYDAVFFTIIAAITLAGPSPKPTLDYFIGGFCIFFAIRAGRRYLKADSLRRDNGKENPNT